MSNDEFLILLNSVKLLNENQIKVMTRTLKNIDSEQLSVLSEEEKAIQVLQKYYERKIRILERLSKEIEKKSRDEKRINEKPM